MGSSREHGQNVSVPLVNEKDLFDKDQESKEIFDCVNMDLPTYHYFGFNFVPTKYLEAMFLELCWRWMWRKRWKWRWWWTSHNWRRLYLKREANFIAPNSQTCYCDQLYSQVCDYANSEDFLMFRPFFWVAWDVNGSDVSDYLFNFDRTLVRFGKEVQI